jgi:hypothetical protein
MSAVARRLAGVISQARAGRHAGLQALALGIYLTVVFAVMLWRGLSITPDRVLLLIFIAALVAGRGWAFLRDWVPFLVIFLAWEVMRGFADKAGAAVHYADFVTIDRTLGFGSVPTQWLQAHLYHAGSVGILDVFAMSLYFLHFPLPLVVGFLLWMRNRAIYLRFVSALMLMSLAAFAVFLIMPVAPPWLAAQHGLLPGVVKIADATVSKLHQNIDLGPVYNALYSLNPNKVAAFPSLHGAFPLLAFLYAWRTFGRRAWPLLPYTFAVWFSIVYLGEHYVIDAIGGAAFAITAFVLTERFLRPALREHGIDEGLAGSDAPRIAEAV